MKIIKKKIKAGGENCCVQTKPTYCEFKNKIDNKYKK